MAWVQRTADESGWPHAIVGYADLLSTDVRPQLDALARYPPDAGRAHATALARERGLSICRAPRPVYRSGADRQREAARGLWLDLRAAGLQRPDGRGGRARRGLPAGDLRAAACGHARGPVAGGSGGLAQRPAPSLPPGPTWSPSSPASAPSSTATIPVTSPGSSRESVALFGAQRCLFGSNFPIEKLWTGYKDLLDAHLQASAALTPAAADQHLRRHGAARLSARQCRMNRSRAQRKESHRQSSAVAETQARRHTAAEPDQQQPSQRHDSASARPARKSGPASSVTWSKSTSMPGASGVPGSVAH